MAQSTPQRRALTDDEREGIVLAVNSAFRKLKNLYAKIVPIFEDFGFTPPSAGSLQGTFRRRLKRRSFSTASHSRRATAIAICVASVRTGRSRSARTLV